MAGCGFTPDQIDDMPWADVAAVFTLWGRTPPTHEAVRRIGEGLGIEKPLSTPELSVEEVRNRPPPEGSLSIEELKASAARNGFDPSGIGDSRSFRMAWDQLRADGNG